MQAKKLKPHIDKILPKAKWNFDLEDLDKIMHIALPIGKNNVLMASDVLESMGQVMENDNRHTISISAESREEANKLFNGLSSGGQIEMPIADGPLGIYFGMFADKYGIQWMADFDPTPPAECRLLL